ncbi:MAG: hypothetical protein H8D38_06160 [DPANN group archaeon]|nr:hypothetical protein [DPANN group archaeon]
MKVKLLFALLVIALLLMAGCAKQAEEPAPDTLDASVAEVDDLDNELVDPELDSELDNINLDDW